MGYCSLLVYIYIIHIYMHPYGYNVIVIINNVIIVNSSQQLHVWIQNTLTEYGLEVYTHNYTAGRIVLQPQDNLLSDIHGTNVYGILRAGRSSSVETIVLTAPDKLGNNKYKICTCSHVHVHVGCMCNEITALYFLPHMYTCIITINY